MTVIDAPFLCNKDKCTYWVHIARQHHLNESSHQCWCHECNQSTWSEQLCKQGHQELWWCWCFVQSMHCCTQLHLTKGRCTSTKFAVTTIVLSLTRAWIAKLSTGHIGINCCPQMITHCPPMSIETHLHSSIHASSTIPQPDTAMWTACKTEVKSLPVVKKILVKKLTSSACNSSIIRVETICSVTVMSAVNQPGLSCCAGNIIKSYDDVGVLSKVCIAISSCICRRLRIQL